MGMNKNFKPMYGVLETGFVTLAGGWLIGATGAVGAKSGGQGMTLVRDDVGTYHIQVTGANGVAAVLPTFLHASVSAFNPDTDPSNDTDAHFVKMLSITASTGQVAFQCVDEAGVVRELPNPAVITAHIDLKVAKAP